MRFLSGGRNFFGKTLASLLLAGGSLNANSQTYFQGTYGGIKDDSFKSVIENSSGDYVSAGETESFGAGGKEGYLVKTNPNGNVLWSKTYGGNNDDSFSSVLETSNGEYLLAGHTKSFGLGGSDGYLIKTNPNGNVLWSKTYGGNNDDSFSSVLETSSGEYLLFGSTMSHGSGSKDLYLVKMDTNGNVLWSKTYGGPNSDIGYSLQETSDGKYLAAGSTSSFGAGSWDAYLIKTDANGNLLWSKTYGGANADHVYSLKETSGGDYLLSGSTSSFGAGSWDAYLIKTDTDGDVIWSKTYGGANADYVYSSEEADGYIFSGSTSSFSGSWNVYLFKTDSSGNLSWSKGFGGGSPDNNGSFKKTSDGGYILSGDALSFGLGDVDAYIIKTDSLGNGECNNYDFPLNEANQLTIAKNEGVTSNGGAGNASAAIENNALTIEKILCSSLPVEMISFEGRNEGKINILEWTTASEINNDYFSVEKSRDGKIFEEIARITGAGNSAQPNNYEFIDRKPYNGLNYYKIKQTDFDRESSYSDIEIVKTSLENILKVYPNPAKNEIFIEKNFDSYAVFEIYDILGRKILEEILDESHEKINVEDLSKGSYIYRLRNAENSEIFNGKLLIE